jgi:hypothetical protein
MGKTNVGELADAIMCLAAVDGTGLMDFGSMDMYADALGTDYIDVDDTFDAALVLLEEEGKVTEVGDSYYKTEEMNEYLRVRAEEEADARQYEHDAFISYGQNIWGHA